MKEKISISLDSALIAKADSIIDGKYVRNRSQAFEHVLYEFFSSKKISQAIVLLGLAHKIPKDGIEILMSKLRDSGIRQAIIAGGKNNERIFGMLGSGERYGIKVDYLQEEQLLGTAGCVRLAAKMLHSTFLVVAGDTYFDFDIRKMAQFHFEKKSIATMGITAVKLEDSTDSIMLEGDKITSFTYNVHKKSHMTNAGVYIFEPEILESLPDKGSLEKDVFPKLAEQGRLFAYAFYREWKHNE